MNLQRLLAQRAFQQAHPHLLVCRLLEEKLNQSQLLYGYEKVIDLSLEY